jgi:hypothetical protein
MTSEWLGSHRLSGPGAGHDVAVPHYESAIDQDVPYSGRRARAVALGGPVAVLSCDPAMCAVLVQHGIPAGNLLVLGPGSTDPLGSAVVLATAAVRNMFGSRLDSVYAPDTLASFGAGQAQIDIRIVAPGRNGGLPDRWPPTCAPGRRPGSSWSTTGGSRPRQRPGPRWWPAWSTRAC